MPWLMRDGLVLAAIEEAGDPRARRRGLLGREGIDGALLIRPARSVHTVGMRFAIDVAFCRVSPPPGPPAGAEVPETAATSLLVVDTVSMARHRIGRPRWRATCVIEAEAGAFERWQLRPGDRLEIRYAG